MASALRRRLVESTHPAKRTSFSVSAFSAEESAELHTGKRSRVEGSQGESEARAEQRVRQGTGNIKAAVSSWSG